MTVFFLFFFAYKRHDFFLFKKYILHVLVISGIRSWKQHIHTIFTADILYSINCLHVYIKQMYSDHQRWPNNKEKLSKASFLPSVEHICYSILNFVLNRSENLINRFCWNWIIFNVDIVFGIENTEVWC